MMLNNVTTPSVPSAKPISPPAVSDPKVLEVVSGFNPIDGLITQKIPIPKAAISRQRSDDECARPPVHKRSIVDDLIMDSFLSADEEDAAKFWNNDKTTEATATQNSLEAPEIIFAEVNLNKGNIKKKTNRRKKAEKSF